MKSKLRIILSRLIILLLLAVVAYAVIDFIDKRKQSRSLNDYLSTIDALLADGREAEAADLLADLPGERISSYQYLMVAKRMWRLRDSQKSNELLETLTREAVEEYPGNQDLAVVRSYALLAANRPEAAYRYASTQLKDDRYLGLIAQAGLASGAEFDDSFFERAEGIAYSFAGLIALVNDTPQAEAYASAGSEWQILELIADASLLYARRGEISTANELLRRSAYLRFPELELQIAYDAGDFAHGLAALEGIPAEDRSVVLYRADFLYQAGRKDAAAELYRILIEEAPAYSPLAYLNLAALFPDEAVPVLERGVEAFPLSLTLLERLGEALYQQGDTGRSADIFSRVLAINPDRAAARIRLSESRRGSGALGDISRLWDAYHGAEEKEAFASQLAWRLYGERDREGLALLVDYQASRTDGKRDLSAALLSVLKGEYVAAAENFLLLGRRDKDWRYAHNRGLLYRHAGRYEESIDAFQEADQILTQGVDENRNRKARSLVWLGKAETQLAMGERKNAAVSLSFALDLDSDNLRAGLLQATMNR